MTARRAALATAKRALDNTTVREMHDGLVVGLTISTGEMVGPGQLLFTLINTEEWFADWNFRETDLAAIARQGGSRTPTNKRSWELMRCPCIL